MKRLTNYATLSLLIGLALSFNSQQICSAQTTTNHQSTNNDNHGKVNAQGVPFMLMRPEAEVEYAPDPTKMLTIDDFKKGLKKLHDYLTQAITKATDLERAFLIKEKAEIEKQIAKPEQAYQLLFTSIEQQTQRLLKQRLFPVSLTKQMRKHLLETQAALVIGSMQQEQKRRPNDQAFLAEMNYQLGIIAQRDQVNYQSAIRYFQRAVNHQANNIDYLEALAQMYGIMENHASTIKILEQLLNVLEKQPHTEQSAQKALKIKQQLNKTRQDLNIA